MKPSVLVVAHDAGGAEILRAWCGKHKEDFQLLFALDGPARRVFLRDMPDIALSGIESMASFCENDVVLTGTSLEADLERRAIAMARQYGIHCISFLDHWDLYRERFGTFDAFFDGLPDEVWVGDQYAHEIALAQGFPGASLRLVENPYFEEVWALRQKGEVRGEPRSVLYICEPISRKLAAAFGEAARQYDDELAIMEKFFQALCDHQGRFDRITLRLHPSEPRDKYDGITNRYKDLLPVAISGNALLVDDILSHGVIVGIESNALFIGVLLKKPVFSCIPGKQWEISLPHREIHRVTAFYDVFSRARRRHETCYLWR